MLERVTFKRMFSGKWNFQKSCLSVNMKVPRCLTELKSPFLKGFSSPASIPGFLRIPEHCIACSSVCKMIVLENAWTLTKLREQRKQREGNLWSEVWMVGHELPAHLCWWSQISKICLWPQWVMSPFYTETTPLLLPPAGVQGSSYAVVC